MNDKITEIKNVMSEATPGPWVATGDAVSDDSHEYEWICQMYEGDEDSSEPTREFSNANRNAYFIAKSPEYITYLLQLVETQSKALEWYADKDNYDPVRLEMLGYLPIDIDEGQKAREALSII